MSRPFYSCVYGGWLLCPPLVVSVSNFRQRVSREVWVQFLACLCDHQFFLLGDRRVIIAALAACLVVGGGSLPAMYRPEPPPTLFSGPCSTAAVTGPLASCLLECAFLRELGECDTAVGLMAQERAPVLTQPGRYGCGAHSGSPAVCLTG